MNTETLYAERDTYSQGDHYMKHVSAMTGEKLYSKSAIAAELAHRDITIERLTSRIKELEKLDAGAAVGLGTVGMTALAYIG
jgi:hypothetical protein